MCCKRAFDCDEEPTHTFVRLLLISLLCVASSTFYFLISNFKVDKEQTLVGPGHPSCLAIPKKETYESPSIDCMNERLERKKRPSESSWAVTGTKAHRKRSEPLLACRELRRWPVAMCMCVTRLCMLCAHTNIQHKVYVVWEKLERNASIGALVSGADWMTEKKNMETSNFFFCHHN